LRLHGIYVLEDSDIIFGWVYSLKMVLEIDTIEMRRIQQGNYKNMNAESQGQALSSDTIMFLINFDLTTGQQPISGLNSNLNCNKE